MTLIAGTGGLEGCRESWEPRDINCWDRRTGGLQGVMARAGGKLAVRNTKSMKKLDCAACM